MNMLKPEQIKENWEKFLWNIDQYISSPRKQKLLEFYKKYEQRIVLMPAAHKKEYHNSFPGGYIDHVNRVVECAININKVWEEMGVDTSTYTQEELIFSAINHDLGKIGDTQYESYIPQTDQWRKEKLGEDYTFNNKLPFASVPDRGLFLLQDNDIKYTFNEMIAIQTHDGLYDEANKKYLMPYASEQKPRTALPFILHQADLMASRIEWEHEWLGKLKGETNKIQKPTKTKFSSTKNKKLQNMLNNI